VAPNDSLGLDESTILRLHGIKRSPDVTCSFSIAHSVAFSTLALGYLSQQNLNIPMDLSKDGIPFVNYLKERGFIGLHTFLYTFIVTFLTIKHKRTFLS